MFQKDDWKVGSIATVFGCLLLYFSLTTELSENVLAISDIAGPFGVPNIVAVIIIAIGLLHILAAFLLRNDTSTSEKTKKEKAGEISQERVVVLVIIISAVYILLLSFLGYLISTCLLIAVLMYLFYERNWKKTIVFSVLFTGALFLIFNNLLNVNLPPFSVLN